MFLDSELKRHLEQSVEICRRQGGMNVSQLSPSLDLGLYAILDRRRFHRKVNVVLKSHCRTLRQNDNSQIQSWCSLLILKLPTCPFPGLYSDIGVLTNPAKCFELHAVRPKMPLESHFSCRFDRGFFHYSFLPAVKCDRFFHRF